MSHVHFLLADDIMQPLPQNNVQLAIYNVVAAIRLHLNKSSKFMTGACPHLRSPDKGGSTV